MTIGEICNHEVVHTARDTTIHTAAKLMRHYHVGTLVVVDELSDKRVPVGIVTDRDIVVEVNAVDLDSKVITVGDIMGEELVTIGESAGLFEAMEVMRFKSVRRLPVVGKEGQLVGIISTDDVLEILAEELNDLSRIITREQVHETQVRR
jgi:predicted transcriptional regulator